MYKTFLLAQTGFQTTFWDLGFGKLICFDYCSLDAQESNVGCFLLFLQKVSCLMFLNIAVLNNLSSRRKIRCRLANDLKAGNDLSSRQKTICLLGEKCGVDLRTI